MTNMLKRFFSREDSRTESAKPDTELNNLIPGSESFPKGSVKRIADQVIEEVIFSFVVLVTVRLQLWKHSLGNHPIFNKNG